MLSLSDHNRESRDPGVPVPPVRARGLGYGPSYGAATVRATTPAEPLTDGHFCWKEHVVLRLGRWRLSPCPPFCPRPSCQVLPGASGQWPAALWSSTAPCTCLHVLTLPTWKPSVSPHPFLSWDPAVLGYQFRPQPQHHRQAGRQDRFGDRYLHVCVSLRLALPRLCVARLGSSVGASLQGLGQLEGPDGVAGGGDSHRGSRAVGRAFQMAWILFACPLSLPSHPGLQPNLLPFPQQQSSLLLPPTGPGLASQVNSPILLPPEVSRLPTESCSLGPPPPPLPPPLGDVLTPWGQGTSRGIACRHMWKIQATGSGLGGTALGQGCPVTQALRSCPDQGQASLTAAPEASGLYREAWVTAAPRGWPQSHGLMSRDHSASGSPLGASLETHHSGLPLAVGMGAGRAVGPTVGRLPWPHTAPARPPEKGPCGLASACVARPRCV